VDQVLKDKVAVITGGSRGLGLAIAQAYARAGAQVVIASRTRQSVASALELLKAAGARADGLVCDVADIAQVEALARYAIKTFGRIDIWVNNAGLSAPYGPTAHIPSQMFSNVVNTNIVGTYNGSVVAMRHFVPQKSGKLINLLGRGDTGAIKYQNAYSSSKVWVRNFTKALAAEYKHSGVDVFGFNPGLVRTEMLSQVQAVSGFESKVTSIRFVAALWGHDVDVPAQRALWLASAATDGKTGLMLTVLTPGFMLGRLFTIGLRWLLRAPVEMMDLNVSSVEPVTELAPVLIDAK
jgi:NAD(P)-dependent dehydrogenase (short-subunit alcohol dehydrogenase family)